jgi:multiple sugar transport system substrate-binding protein
MRRRTRSLLAIIAGAAMVGSATAACSSSGGGGGGGSNDMSHGPITFVQGKDTSGIIPALTQAWNKDHPSEKVTVVQQTDQADQQHDDLVQHFQSKDAGYDVVLVDVIWTAEFAAKQWLQPLTGQFAVDTNGLLQGPVKAATYNGTLYAAPETSDGGLLYYRKDLVSTPPTTWKELIADCSKATQGMGCYGGQFAQYEGLTVNAAEAINSAGGEIVAADGTTPKIDSPQAKEGLNFLVNGFKQGYIPHEALTWQEEESRQAFQSGKLLFLRNWPYVYNHLVNDSDSVVKDKFGIAPLPGLNGLGKSSLGGHSAAISEFSDHKGTALDFLKWILGNTAQNIFLNVGSLAPVNASLYSNAADVKKFPYLPVLEKSINTAIPRPVSPYYPAITQGIEQNVFKALNGQTSVDAAVKNISEIITNASKSG